MEGCMGAFDKLTFTDATRAKGYDPVRLRRRKLANAIQDQIRLLDAEAEGGGYAKVVRRRSHDLETDAVVESEHHRRVSPWWWTDDSGDVNLAVRYGSITLKLKGDKTTIIVKSRTELPPILNQLRTEVLAGTFDDALAGAAGALKARFGRRTQA
jgi:hypothetical protein